MWPRATLGSCPGSCGEVAQLPCIPPWPPWPPWEPSQQEETAGSSQCGLATIAGPIIPLMCTFL